MRFGIVIAVYNRPEYLSKCLDSLKASIIPEGTLIVMINDNSTDQETIRQFNEFTLPGVEIQKIANGRNKKVSGVLLTGFNNCFAEGCEIVMNLDSDAIVKPDFVQKLVDMKERFINNIVTGFNCMTRGDDGNHRHPVIEVKEDHILKRSVGGINMVLHRRQFSQYVEPALLHVIADQGNWDHLACIASMKDDNPIVCLTPSVIQHIGQVSSMGHTNTALPDIASDFFSLSLDEVTLICVDCIHLDQALAAADISSADIGFAEVVILSSQPSTDPRVKRIDHIASKEQYSEFMVKRLADYVRTPYMLVIQYDGYVLNYKAWKPEFLEYDYIGATWGFKDGKNVGNGGFSLRSLKLHKALQADSTIINTHPEDNIICREYREHLEKTHGIKFATEEVANRFGIESWGSNDNKYSGQFGFHGYRVDFTNSGLPHIPVKKLVIPPPPAQRRASRV